MQFILCKQNENLATERSHLYATISFNDSCSFLFNLQYTLFYRLLFMARHWKCEYFFLCWAHFRSNKQKAEIWIFINAILSCSREKKLNGPKEYNHDWNWLCELVSHAVEPLNSPPLKHQEITCWPNADYVVWLL